MRLIPGIALISLVIVASSTPSLARGGHRGRCFGPYHRAGAAPMGYPIAVRTMSPLEPTMTLASPQTPSAIPASPVAPVATAPMTILEVQPSYNYTAAATGQPAYYYTYDAAGKLVVAQWMDWLFRGGRAVGDPVPPLPLIGALRGR